jgi:2-polyprenyl-3-methyl-5-hydroxy-6-metoxy-1,4-benzoquinol methylase
MSSSAALVADDRADGTKLLVGGKPATDHAAMAIDDPKDLVRRGYDALSWHYRRDDADDGAYGPWLAALRERLPAGAQVLDLGCGCGIPVARSLANAGYAVTGVDFSNVQLQRARRLVPTARLLHADAAKVTFPAATFDAVICLYMLFHLPLAEQPLLLGRIAGWLRPGGWLLATTAKRAWTGIEDGWLSGPAPMWWSQAGAATYRDWIRHAGLELAAEELVPDGLGAGSHPLFWARRPRTGEVVG